MTINGNSRLVDLIWVIATRSIDGLVCLVGALGAMGFDAPRHAFPMLFAWWFGIKVGYFCLLTTAVKMSEMGSAANAIRHTLDTVFKINSVTGLLAAALVVWFGYPKTGLLILLSVQVMAFVNLRRVKAEIA